MPFIGIAQITDNLFLEFNTVFVDDLEYTNKDINLFSPDMSSGYNNKSDIEQGVSMSFGYNFSDKLSFGVSYIKADVSASNDIEYFVGNFTDKSVFANYDLCNIQKIVCFVHASMGEVEYNASRFLVYDDSELPINSPNGKANKKALGLGLQVNLKNHTAIVAKYIINEIEDDGFDGWDYGSGVDRFAIISIGLKLNL
ncbi:MAG: hypothetical protein CMP70_02640 [Flavobacteriales bacterium]|nr:hypothetical protein [Flavobacteriales bacterium]|tara:strand:+ start:1113 stop:1706 length:594 start_codon:yes stop_codon:yes gene_type:complete